MTSPFPKCDPLVGRELGGCQHQHRRVQSIPTPGFILYDSVGRQGPVTRRNRAFIKASAEAGDPPSEGGFFDVELIGKFTPVNERVIFGR